jgi:hypothetical protein
MRKAKDVNTAQPAGMNVNRSTLLKLLACGMLVLLTADLQAQLLFRTKFSSAEGYTNGWIIGQPSIRNKWINANADYGWVAANDPTYVKVNNGCSWWPTTAQLPGWPGGPWYIATITNCTATGGALKIASDNNNGTNAQTYFFKMDFPTQRTGPITVTWDWQFHCTNEIPADYDPTNNSYHSVLPGYDHGFTLSDWQNRFAGNAPSGNPNWVYSDLCTPFRLGDYQDGRHNGIGVCGGSGDWNNYGPEFKDGKVLHMKMMAYVTNAPVEIMDSYASWCQRDGEDIWQTTFNTDTNVTFYDAYGNPSDKYISASGMRRCPGEYDPTSGINCVMLWMNGTQTTDRYVLVSNIVVLGPIPVLSIERSGANVVVTYSGTLQSCDTPNGVYADVVGQSTDFMKALKTFVVTPTVKKQFYRAVSVN